MKELKAHLKEEIQIRVDKQQQKESRLQLLGTIKPKKGQFIFEIDTVTGEVFQAEFVCATVDYADAVKGNISAGIEMVVKENCIYIPAINEANALKKYKKNPNQDAYYAKDPILSFSDITF